MGWGRRGEGCSRRRPWRHVEQIAAQEEEEVQVRHRLQERLTALLALPQVQPHRADVLNLAGGVCVRRDRTERAEAECGGGGVCGRWW